MSVIRRLCGALLLGFLVNCSAPSPPPPPDQTLFEPPDTAVNSAPLPDAVVATRNELLSISAADSLRRLARFADSQPGFASNLSGSSDHYAHWDLMRRTGFDPNQQIAFVLQFPHATRQIGDQTWYIWPYLAARSGAELAPERLSFVDLTTLRELIGRPGLDWIGEHGTYPGVRTAISEDGTWRYFLNEPVSDGERPQ